MHGTAVFNQSPLCRIPAVALVTLELSGAVHRGNVHLHIPKQLSAERARALGRSLVVGQLARQPLFIGMRLDLVFP